MLVDIKRVGSSPRVRGTDLPVARRRRGQRFIPACAGNRVAVTTTKDPSSVHPRVCGEQRKGNGGIHPAPGSSPRVRGTGRHTHIETGAIRFIPACAGNRPRRPFPEGWAAVHPRVCGEQYGSKKGRAHWHGSSPRVRGTAGDVFRLAVLPRFIPACAGNSPSSWSHSAILTVHPRVCGEQWHRPRKSLAHAGSSPRVRGTAAPAVSGRAGHRFIPACAGNRAHRAIPVSLNAVHPRVCGEQSTPCRRRPSASGSSPRVRGTACLSAVLGLGVRFIPACAGNSERPVGILRKGAVHPRVCGEQTRAATDDGV